MSSEHWQQLKQIFNAAISIAPNERAQFLDERCGGDENLRREVETLLKADVESFMETPLIGKLAEAIIKNPSSLAAGTRIGHYKILELLGAGGMGEVYLAEDRLLGRRIALKILLPESQADRERVSRFLQEARAASALNHPNILTVHEVGESNGVRFIAAEFIEGETLRERMGRERLSFNECLDVALQTAAALAAAHRNGIVHRDIKPENIMLRRDDGLVKVLDFGLAKLSEESKTPTDTEAETRAMLKTKPGVVMGTVAYMSPEQIRGKETDARTDIWSLGVVLYELLTGRAPFEGETTSDIIAAILQTEPLLLSKFLPNAPAELQRIVRKTLQKNANERYQNAKDLQIDLSNLRREVEREAEDSVAPINATKSITAATNETAAPSKETTHPPASSVEYIVSGIKRRKSTSIAALLILLSAIGGLGYWYFSSRLTNAKQIESIAVLPFVNESGNADNEYLSDGMTETLIGSLSRIPKLNVKARTSVFRYKDKETDLPKIAGELNVQAILTGRVLQRGEQLRLNLELVDVKTENVIWSEQYNRKQTDLVSLQSEIARDVANKLRLKLSGVDERKLAKNYTENAEAYQLYLKGRYYWEKFPAPGFEKSRDYFQQAIALDPHYALAYAGLADYYGIASAVGILPPDENWLKAEAAAKKAQELDESRGEAYNPLAAVRLYYYRDWAGAEQVFQRGIELSPNFAEIRYHYAVNLMRFGRSEEALAQMKKVLELEPLSARFNRSLAWMFYQMREYDRAIEQCRKTFELEPNDALTHERLGYAYEQKGMPKEAVAEWSKALTLTEDNESAMMLERTFAASGFNAAVRTLWQKNLERLNEKVKRGEYVPAMNYALADTRLADREQAFAWLAKAEQERNALIFDVNRDPIYDSLRDDPRFQELLRRVGFPA